MRTIIFIMGLCFTLFVACSKGIITVEYQRLDRLTKEGDAKYFMKIPSGFKVMHSVGDHELEKQYTYQDSVKLYISDWGYSDLTENYIRSMGDSIAKKRFAPIESNSKMWSAFGKEYKYEDMVLEGKNSKGLYWKDMRIGFISIGYINVPEKRKISFDSALNSFKVLRN